MTTDPILLHRGCEVNEDPSGIRCRLESGTRVRVMQVLHGGYIVATDHGVRYRVEERDADALGLLARAAEQSSCSDVIGEEQIRKELKTVFDPEIPVDIVELGLIYSIQIAHLDGGAKRVEIKMTMTSPGCGMANVLKMDVENKLLQLPKVKEVNVEVVFDPPWHPGMMSEGAKLQLGFDLDYGITPSNPTAFKVIR